jgi:hypothetical protein
MQSRAAAADSWCSVLEHASNPTLSEQCLRLWTHSALQMQWWGSSPIRNQSRVKGSGGDGWRGRQHSWRKDAGSQAGLKAYTQDQLVQQAKLQWRGPLEGAQVPGSSTIRSIKRIFLKHQGRQTKDDNCARFPDLKGQLHAGGCYKMPFIFQFPVDHITNFRYHDVLHQQALVHQLAGANTSKKLSEVDKCSLPVNAQPRHLNNVTFYMERCLFWSIWIVRP